MIFWWLDM